MGRPLFSQAYVQQAPAVRVAQPEEQDAFPTYDRWSVSSPWDPDADEWFEAPEAVFEAFLTPAQVAEAARAAQGTIAGLAAEEEDGSDGSEAATSGRATPMAVGGEDPAQLIAAALRPFARTEPASGVADNARNSVAVPMTPPREAFLLPDAPEALPVAPVTLSPPRPPRYSTPAVLRTLGSDMTPRVLGINAWSLDALAAARNTTRTPPPAEAPRSAAPAPMTPPAVSTPRTLAAPSPLVSTPHILAWHRTSGVLAGSPPARDSPLSNAGARRSLAHIQPMSLRA